MFTKFAKTFLASAPGKGILGKTITETHSNLGGKKKRWILILRIWAKFYIASTRRAKGLQTGLGPGSRKLSGAGMRGAPSLLKSQSPLCDSGEVRCTGNKC